MQQRLIALILPLIVLLGCAEEPPPRSVAEFVENPMLLEATVVRCAADRVKSRDDAECVNAREAVKRVAAKEEAARRARLEAESERKRKALRQTQEAAARARRRAAEAERLQAEALYQSQFSDSLENGDAVDASEANRPTAEVPQAVDASGLPPAERVDESSSTAPDPGTDREALRPADDG